MAQSAATQVMIVKACVDGDVRRINMTLQEDAAAAQMLQAIRAAVADAFDMTEASLPALKYRDEDDDLCTLVPASVDDMFELNNKGTLRLFASNEAVASSGVQDAAISECPVHAEIQPEPVEEPVAEEVAVESEPDDETVEEAVVGPDESSEEAVAIDAEASPNSIEVVQEVEVDENVEDGTIPDDVTSGVSDQGEPQHVLGSSLVPHLPRGLHESTDDTDDVAVLTGMGFALEDARHALQESGGSVELAIDMLINGMPSRSQPLEKLEETVRALPGHILQAGQESLEELQNLRSQLGEEVVKPVQETVRALPGHIFQAGQVSLEELQNLRSQLGEDVANLKQKLGNMKEQYDSGDSQHLQDLQAALEEVKTHLHQYRYAAQGAVKKARGTTPSADEEEQLQKVEAQIADAQQFLTEASAALHARGTDIEQKVEAQVADAQQFLTEASASLHARGTDMLQSASLKISSTDSSTTPASDSQPAPNIADATKMDHVQVFVSQSISAIRSFVRPSGLFRRSRSEDWVTVSSAMSASAADPTNDAGLEGAHAVSATGESDTLDEFLLDTALVEQEDVQSES